MKVLFTDMFSKKIQKEKLPLLLRVAFYNFKRISYRITNFPFTDLPVLERKRYE